MPRCHSSLWAVSLLCIEACATLAPSKVEARDPAQICDAAAARASIATGVPLEALRSLSRADIGESKNDGLPHWPWTVNIEGKGVWFETENQARLYLYRHFWSGARSFDVGCFRINYRWYGASFSFVEDMFNADKNALCAAGLLKRLHAELGSWDRAVGAYRSRTHSHAQRYRSDPLTASQTALQYAEREAAKQDNFSTFLSPNSQARNHPRGSLVPLIGAVHERVTVHQSGG